MWVAWLMVVGKRQCATMGRKHSECGVICSLNGLSISLSRYACVAAERRLASHCCRRVTLRLRCRLLPRREAALAQKIKIVSAHRAATASMLEHAKHRNVHYALYTLLQRLYVDIDISKEMTNCKLLTFHSDLATAEWRKGATNIIYIQVEFCWMKHEDGINISIS